MTGTGHQCGPRDPDLAHAALAFVVAAAEVVRASAASLFASEAGETTALVEEAIEALSEVAMLPSVRCPESFFLSPSDSAPLLHLLRQALAAAAATARAVDASFFCAPWLERAGQERFVAASARLRAALKDSVVPAAANALLASAGSRLSSSSASPSSSEPPLARLGEAVEALTSLGVRASVAIRGGGGGGGASSSSSPLNAASAPSPSSSPPYPLPMRSFALINVAVTGASRLLSAVADETEDRAAEEAGKARDSEERGLIRSAASKALAALAGPTAAACLDLVSSATAARGSGGDAAAAEQQVASKLTPVRFWAQHVLKLVAAHPKGCIVSGGGDGDEAAAAASAAAGERFAGALAALASAEAKLSLSLVSCSASASSSTTLAAAKGVISKTAAALAACWASCCSSEDEGEENAAAAAASALAALLSENEEVHKDDDDARAIALVLLLQASSATKSSELVCPILPGLARRVSGGERALRDAAWRDGAASAVADALSAAASCPTSLSLWPSAETALFEAALTWPTPAARELVGEAWAGMFRRLFAKAASSSSSASSSSVVVGVLETHASALAAAAAGAASVAVSSSFSSAAPSRASPPLFTARRNDAEALSEHLSLLAARLLSALPCSSSSTSSRSTSTPSTSSSTSSPLGVACRLLEETDDMLAVARGRPEASAAAAAVVKVALAVVAGSGRKSNSNSGGKSAAGTEEEDLWSAANDLLARTSAQLRRPDDRWFLEDLSGSMLLLETLCAGCCSAPFDEGGGFESGSGGDDGGHKGNDDDGASSPPRVGPLGLYRAHVEEAASHIVRGYCGDLGAEKAAALAIRKRDGGGGGGGGGQHDGEEEEKLVTCTSAALRALAATGLPLPPAPFPAPLLLPESLAAWERADAGAATASAASALAPLLAEKAEKMLQGARGNGGGRPGVGGVGGVGVSTLYRALLLIAQAEPCFVALHTTAVSLIAHARSAGGGGGDGSALRSCVPPKMLPERRTAGSGATAASASTTSPFLEMVKAIMKREPPSDSASAVSAVSTLTAALDDAATLCKHLRGAAARVSAGAAERAVAGVEEKVKQALASLMEVEAAVAAEAARGRGAAGGEGVPAAALALEEVAAAAQRIKRQCV